MSTPESKSEQDRDRLRLYEYLKFARKQREDGLIVPDYNIQKESTLHMNLRLVRGGMILVKTMADTTIMVQVELSDTVYDVMKKIEDLEGIPVEEQRLVYLISSLERNRTLAYYGIHKGATVRLVVWSYLGRGFVQPSDYLSYVDYMRRLRIT
ncbi:unnamed protein product [Urochloa humidicola]